MPRRLTPTQLRADLYRVLDEVLETGEPCEVIRGGQRLAIIRMSPARRDLDALPRRRILNCTPEELEGIHWEYEPGENAGGDLS